MLDRDVAKSDNFIWIRNASIPGWLSLFKHVMRKFTAVDNIMDFCNLNRD